MNHAVDRQRGPAQRKPPRALRWLGAGVPVAVLLLTVALLPSAIARQQPDQPGLERDGELCHGYQQCSDDVLGAGVLVRADDVCSDERTAELWRRARSGRMEIQQVLAEILVRSRDLCPSGSGSPGAIQFEEFRTVAEDGDAEPATASGPPAAESPPADPGPRLDLQIDDSWRRDVDAAISMLRRYGQLAEQRMERTDGLVHFDRLLISDTCGEFDEVAQPCEPETVATSLPDPEQGVCSIELYPSKIRAQARGWDLTVPQLTAMVLVHEQEHCLVEPEQGETQAVEAAFRFAHQVGDPDMIAYQEQLISQLDADGNWEEAGPGPGRGVPDLPRRPVRARSRP
ncbi:MAG TPA: hypothetical protein VKG45_00345 [Actinomycetes bacterium]|nr:hypothetical protein [Actinomycetes bacterium]